MYLILFLLSFFLPLSFTEVICNPTIPRVLLPTLPSCNYALQRLRAVSAECGPGHMSFSPTVTGPSIIPLPKTFLGGGPDYTPSLPIWCTILLLGSLWQNAGCGGGN